MPNPLSSMLSFLRGDDLRAPGALARLEQMDLPTPVQEIKLFFQPGTYQGGLSPYLQASLGNDALAGMTANSAVFACLHTLCTDYPEANLRVYRGDAESDQADVLIDHDLEELWKKPNLSLTGKSVGYWLQWAKQVDGNAYLRKVRGPGLVPVELWPVSPAQMWPVTTKEDSARGVFISYYAYAPDPTNRQIIEKVPIEDIVHFRLGLDPNDRRLGCSPLKHLFREVFGDDEAAKWTESLLKNYAVPGLIVTIPREESRLFTEEMALALKAKIEAAFSNDNRGHVNVLKGGATMEQFGFSPEQLSLTSIRRHFEERVSAALRVPLAVAGLGGTSQLATHSNLRELRELYTETALLPQYTFDAATINLQLLPDFTKERRVFARYDISKMRALQEDVGRLWSRLDNAVKTGWMVPDTACKIAGVPLLPDGMGALPLGGPKPESLPGDAVSSPVANSPLPDARRNGSANRIFNPSLNSAPSDLDQRALQHAPTVTPATLPDVLDALVQQVIPSLERDVQGYLTEQQRRVLAGLEAHPYVPSGNGVAS